MPEYEESADARIDRERTEEARAFFSALAAAAGLPEIPRVNTDSERVPRQTVKESIARLGQTQHIPRPLRLELLARLAAPALQNDDDDLKVLASTLVDSSDLEAQLGVGEDLVKLLRTWKEGNEPLGRTMLSDLTSPPAGHIGSYLHPEIQSTMLTFDVGCDEADVKVNGIRAVSFVTDMHTTRPLNQFERVVNPFKWPGCWLESFFFKSMVAVPNAPKAVTPLPDGTDGWKQTLLETVDFGFAIAPDGTQELQTQLDFLFFWNVPATAALVATPHGLAGVSPPNVTLTVPTGPAGFAAASPEVTRSQVPAAGCTYDLRSSYDSQILVDQGYLLAEEVPSASPGHSVRRYRTQKEVRFASFEPPDNACKFWSLATGMIMQGC